MIMETYKILYLNGQDVERLGAADMGQALSDVEEALKLVYKGETIVPEKIAMNFGKRLEDEATSGRINAMPGYIGGSFDMAGIKWIGSNPLNLKYGLPRASAITVLNDPKNKFPICILNGSEISAVRTGAASGVAAKYLARQDAETLMLVGAGYQNTKQLEAIQKCIQSLKYFYVVDIVEATAKAFAETMSKKLNIEVIPLTSILQCDRDPDITVNATSAAVPVMDISVARPGNLHICVGGLDHPELYKKADKLSVMTGIRFAIEAPASWLSTLLPERSAMKPSTQNRSARLFAEINRDVKAQRNSSIISQSAWEFWTLLSPPESIGRLEPKMLASG